MQKLRAEASFFPLVFFFTFCVAAARSADVPTIPRSALVTVESGMGPTPRKVTGVYISLEGLVLTCDDAVQSADWIQVEFSDGKTISARVISSEPSADVALLELEEVPGGIAPAPSNFNDDLKDGDPIFLQPQLSSPSVVLQGRVLQRFRPPSFAHINAEAQAIKTDLAINPEDAGAPVFNARGDVVGIVSALLTFSEAGGQAVVIPYKFARQITVEEKSFWSGITGKIIGGETARQLGLPQEQGYLVESVAAASPASKLGVRSGDVLLIVNGISLGHAEGVGRLRRQLKSLAIGAPIRGKVFRNGKTLEIIADFER